MPEAITIMFVVSCVFLSPAVIVGVVLKHRERMAAMRNRQEGAPGVLEELQILRSEMTSLRETTMRYDMSFDAALQRVEQRIDMVEQNQAPLQEALRYGAYSGNAPAEEEVLLRRG